MIYACQAGADRQADVDPSRRASGPPSRATLIARLTPSTLRRLCCACRTAPAQPEQSARTSARLNAGGNPAGAAAQYDAPDGQAQRGRPLEERKTFRWIRGLRDCAEVAGQLAGPRLVAVMDREADVTVRSGGSSCWCGPHNHHRTGHGDLHSARRGTRRQACARRARRRPSAGRRSLPAPARRRLQLVTDRQPMPVALGRSRCWSGRLAHRGLAPDAQVGCKVEYLGHRTGERAGGDDQGGDRLAAGRDDPAGTGDPRITERGVRFTSLEKCDELEMLHILLDV